jgi:hypothetical protein
MVQSLNPSWRSDSGSELDGQRHAGNMNIQRRYYSFTTDRLKLRAEGLSWRDMFKLPWVYRIKQPVRSEVRRKKTLTQLNDKPHGRGLPS